jgi:aminopeptidase
MDPRVREHADVIVDHCSEIEASDNVAINAQPAAEDLVVAVAEAAGERGAVVSTAMGSQRAQRAYMRAVDAEDIALNEMAKAKMEAADVVVSIGGQENVNETGDIPPEKNARRSTENKPIQELVMDEKRWLVTQHPATGNAQKAEMSTEAYEEFVWNAVNKDWDAQREHQAQLVDVLEDGDEVRIRSDDTTDVRMRIADNPVKNDDADNNLPGGEVFTAPVPDSVEGEVLFDKPVMIQGREVLEVHLVFENGEIVEFSAEKNEDVLASLFETDEAATRLGELGIGMNRDIDRFTYNMLFDEKMGDTVHLAVGMAYEDTVSENVERNDSAVHQDMIVDMSEDSVIEVDGEVVQRNGTFRFEDGFED